MKYKLLLFSCLLVFSCSETTQKNKLENKSINDVNSLNNEINFFSMHLDSIKNFKSDCIIDVIFYHAESDSNCSIDILLSNNYDTTNSYLVGYTVIKNKLVCYYNFGCNCFAQYIDTSKIFSHVKLSKKMPDFGMRLRINNNKKIERVYFGETSKLGIKNVQTK